MTKTLTKFEVIEGQIASIENQMSKLIEVVGNVVTSNAVPVAPEPEGNTNGFEVAKGATPPPLTGKAKAPKDGDDARTTGLEGPVTYKQLRALVGMTGPAADGQRIAYMGPVGSPVREYWTFLTKQEASDAISALKAKKPFEYSNGLTIRPR